jgi:hypothetical protein
MSHTKKTFHKRMHTWMKVMAFLIPVLAVFYGVGDEYKWWDYLTGRTAVLEAVERFATAEATPGVIIFDDEPLFKPVERIIHKRASYPKLKEHYQKQEVPTVVCRLGQTMGAYIGKRNPGWPDETFAPDSSVIAIAFDYSKAQYVADNSSHQAVQGEWEPACRLGDLKRWVDESRQRERFWVAIIATSLLSLIVATLDWFRE